MEKNLFQIRMDKKLGGAAMSNIVYVVPWAICDTDSMYIRKAENDGSIVLDKGTPVDDWCIRDIVNNPDRRSKDIFAIIDVYNGYDFKAEKKQISMVELTNSVEKLSEYGYKKADEQELAFLRQRVLKLDKPVKKTAKAKTK